MVRPIDDRPGESGSPVLRAVRRAWWVVLVVAVLAGAVGYLVSSQQSTTYTSRGAIVLKAQQSFDPLGGYSSNDSTRFVANQVSVAASRPVLQQAVGQLPAGTTEQQLSDALTVSAAQDADVITVEATAGTAEGAAQRANAVVAAYRAFVAGQVQATAAAAVAATTDAGVVDQIRTQAAVYGDGVALTEQASVPGEPSGPHALTDALVVALAGALLVIAIAVFRRSPASPVVLDDLADDETVLGTVPVVVGSRGAPRVPAPDDYGLALVSLVYGLQDRPGGALVTGAGPGSQSETVALGLAVAAAARGMQVAVVDADPQRRGVLRIATEGRQPARLLESLVTGDGSPDDVFEPAAVSLPDGSGGGIRVAAMGGPNGSPPHEAAAREALAAAAKSVDLLLVHTGPISADATGYALVEHTAGVVLAVAATDGAEAVDAVRSRLETAGSPLLGLVVVEVHRKGRERPGSAGRGVTGARPVPGGAVRTTG